MGAVKMTVSLVADKEAAKIEQWKRQVILKHPANTRQASGVILHSLSEFMSRLALAFVMMSSKRTAIFQEPSLCIEWR